MDRYFAICDSEEEHVIQLTRQEAISEFGSEVVNRLDQRLPLSTKPRVPAEHCPGCWEHLLTAD